MLSSEPHPSQDPRTLLELFLASARNPDSVERDVVELNFERWTYGDLDVVSSGLAHKIKEKYGLRPTVAIVCENHPYTLATFLASWKLGGVLAPIDVHSPKHLLKQTITNIEPTFVLLPLTDLQSLTLLQEMNQEFMTFDPKKDTITALTQEHLHQSSELPIELYPPPVATDIALHIHTSSASSISNLKCVPLTHRTVLSGTNAYVAWCRKTWTATSFHNVRVCGWSPWSHILGVSKDMCATFATAGCYLFALPPSGYPSEYHGQDNQDIASRLLASMVTLQPDMFNCVPWVVEGMKERWQAEVNAENKEAIRRALTNLKSLGCGGAALSQETISWAKGLGIPLSLDIGMTECGGPLFHAKAATFAGWPKSDCLIPDAKLVLVDDQGDENDSEGELVISSKLIAQGYLKYESTAFVRSPDGTITLFTGDIYEQTMAGCLIWKGRKEDYIQLTSGEYLDPRPIENILDTCPSITRSCIVGDKFLYKAADVVCALIKPAPPSHLGAAFSNAEITRFMASVNRSLTPPLRIPWSRVLILSEHEDIPLNRKGLIFRKKLEDLFGKRIATLLGKITDVDDTSRAKGESTMFNKTLLPMPQGSKDEILCTVNNIVIEVLGLTQERIDMASHSPFADLGMDSNMAVRIVTELNKGLGLQLLLNTCHTHIDLASLSQFILTELGITPAPQHDHYSGIRDSSPAAPSAEVVVIVGQAVRLPGSINTLESFWQALVDKRDDIITPVPADRWDHKSFYRSPTSTTPPQICDITFEKAGFVDVAHFDNHFFGSLALYVSPGVRLTLEASFEALEDANIPVSRVRGTNMGIYVASADGGYTQLLFQDKGFDAYTRFFGTGIATSTACGRLSYLLDVHGPSMTVDTACSSGLVALDLAVKYVQSGEGESAIVCGANIHLWPGSFGFLSAQKMASVHSRCATFSNEADGYASSEGAVAFILKSLTAARRDGDTILAVVDSSDVKHGGRSQGLVAPNVNAQISLQKSLLARGNLKSLEIDFLETHGTGTSLGDLIEIQGINEVFKGSDRKRPLILGAAKSSIGHTELVAGLVGVLKAVASFKHSAVPGIKHLTAHNINPNIDTRIVPLLVPHNTVLLPQKAPGEARHALVLANGFAGTIAGVILNDGAHLGVSTENHIAKPEGGPMLFMLSAKTAGALKQYLKTYLESCQSAPLTQFRSICYTSCIGRELYQYRFACVVQDMDALIAQLGDRLSSAPSSQYTAPTRRVLFAFPGQGSQYQGMAAELAEEYPGFRDTLSSLSVVAAVVSGFPIFSFLVDNETDFLPSTDDGRVSQVCIFVYQCAMCKWLETLGIHPSAVLGHSLGEFAAAVTAGALSFDSALRIVVKRAELLKSSKPGAMASIQASKEVILRVITQLGLAGQLTIAVYNSAESNVLSGEPWAIDVFLAEAAKSGIRSTKLNVDQGFHSSCIDEALPDLQRWLEEHPLFFSAFEIPFFSSAYGRKVATGHKLNPIYWVEHARNPVKFSQIAESALSDQSLDIILDFGPQPFISTALNSFVNQKQTITTSSKRTGSQKLAFMRAIGSLLESGILVDLSRLFGPKKPELITSVPTYPFQRQRHYPSCIPGRNRPHSSPPSVIQSNVRVAPPITRYPIDQPLYDLLADHQIEGRRVLPGAGLVDFFARLAPYKSVALIQFNAPLVIESPDSQTVAETGLGGTFTLYGGSQQPTKICSGTNASEPVPIDPKRYPQEVLPYQILNNDQVYQCFRSIQFGSSFRNIQEVRHWGDHADGLVFVEQTENTNYDRIRKLDCCLHMFGAIAPEEALQIKGLAGSFLPASVEGFTLHSDELPSTFICRYHLPLDVARNLHVLSASFEVLSLSGMLLASCKKYTVAWIPVNAVIPRFLHNNKPSFHGQWLYSKWVPKPLCTENILTARGPMFDELLFFGPDPGSRLSSIFQSFAKQHTLLSINPLHQTDFSEIRHGCSNAADHLVVLDITQIACLPGPGSTEFAAYHRCVLGMMKALVTSRISIANFVVVSSTAMSISSNTELSSPNVTSVIQGMLRVFRRETGLDNIVWGIDLPLDRIQNQNITDIITLELASRQETIFKDRLVEYHLEPGEELPSRFVPILQHVELTPALRSVSGTSIVVGMGSIGRALAPALIAAGGKKVVFLGRRPLDEVHEELLRLKSYAAERFAYVQADACDIHSLRLVMTDIQAQYGDVKNIIHTAAVISDATISNVTVDGFESVLNPKVQGAWNLHMIAEELQLPLLSFVLMSSISVPLGNIGQIAYVAGNSFMDALASYRHHRGLPATSLQLGAWESKLTESMDLSNGLVFATRHDAGIPMIIDAMFIPVPVQVIADLNLGALATTPAYASDPFFRDILQPEVTSVVNKPPRTMSRSEVSEKVIGILRTVMELGPSEHLELGYSLTACGVDSIAFAQIRGRVTNQFSVEVPSVYLQDAFTISDLILFVLERS